MELNNIILSKYILLLLKTYLRVKMKFFIILFICLFFSACSTKTDKAYDKCGEYLFLKEKNVENKGILKMNKEIYADVEIKESSNIKYYEPKIQNYDMFERCTKNYIDLSKQEQK